MSVCLIIMAQTIFQVTSLRLGAFNIQVFGKSKASKPEVMKVLAGILSHYDLVLKQEIRDSSGTSINELLKQVNAANSCDPFEMSLSDRLGRTASKEQYAFLYRPSAFTVLGTYHYKDGDESLNTDTTIVDKFQREPYVVLFESKLTKIGKFAVAGIHVDPDEAVEELKHLEHVFDDAKSRFNVNDVVVMGDLNADYCELRDIGRKIVLISLPLPIYRYKSFHMIFSKMSSVSKVVCKPQTADKQPLTSWSVMSNGYNITTLYPKIPLTSYKRPVTEDYISMQCEPKMSVISLGVTFTI